jgi:hypothetical protein
MINNPKQSQIYQRIKKKKFSERTPRKKKL